jgi:hypothetical protein
LPGQAPTPGNNKIKVGGKKIKGEEEMSKKKIMEFVDEVVNVLNNVGDSSYINALEKAKDLFEIKDVLIKLSKSTGKSLDDKFSLLGIVLDNEIAMKIKEFVILKLKGHEVNLEDF